MRDWTNGDASLRQQMVDRQIRTRGIDDPRLLDAMLVVPREQFTTALTMREAYADAALPIGLGQTISQPYMVARMVELLELRGPERVLEVGTGLGYEAAILSRLAREVVTVERLGDLATKARAILAELGFDNVEVVVGDGSLGHPPRSPYGAIVVAAASPAVPAALEEQLAEGGRLVVPVGPAGDQTLVRVTRRADGLRREYFDRCVFVPLIGAEGY